MQHDHRRPDGSPLYAYRKRTPVFSSTLENCTSLAGALATLLLTSEPVNDETVSFVSAYCQAFSNSPWTDFAAPSLPCFLKLSASPKSARPLRGRRRISARNTFSAPE